ncbi:MAG: cbb3-type cytochrome oxidase assembly protein CcoS [Bernardetiaceae bacterium]|jgi:cbb3-type cytochrome oxidase maturation protein|nr:cbb3-type cytochrome oxidase assembly protein CcoS [Bernardetiaceae bacterium]
MTILFLLIGISLSVALGFLGSFIWAVRTGQYEDSYTPSVRMLFDNELKKPENPTAKVSDQPAKS